MQTRLRFLYRAYRYYYRVDRAELRYLWEKLRPGQVAVDVGCHKGAYAYWMRRRVGPAGRVVAFEPQPRQVAYLRATFDAMGYQNIVLVPEGVSDAPGRLKLHIPAAAGATHGASFVPAKASATAGESVEVGATTLNAYFADAPQGPDFIKIDVEGHELAVLEGARQVLEKYRPTLLVECEARHRPDGDVLGVFAWLAGQGYAGSFFGEQGRRPLSEFDPEIHQQVEPGSDALPKGYVNNFAFEWAG